MTKRTADMAEQPTVPSHPEEVENLEEAPPVSLHKLMDVMTRRFERLLAEQDEHRREIEQTFDSRIGELREMERHKHAPTDSIAHIPVPVQGTKSVTRQRPPRYDGKMPWESYIVHFEISAGLNERSTSEKASFLPRGQCNECSRHHTGRPTARLHSIGSRIGNEIRQRGSEIAELS